MKLLTFGLLLCAISASAQMPGSAPGPGPAQAGDPLPGSGQCVVLVPCPYGSCVWLRTCPNPPAQAAVLPAPASPAQAAVLPAPAPPAAQVTPLPTVPQVPVIVQMPEVRCGACPCVPQAQPKAAPKK